MNSISTHTITAIQGGHHSGHGQRHDFVWVLCAADIVVYLRGERDTAKLKKRECVCSMFPGPWLEQMDRDSTFIVTVALLMTQMDINICHLDGECFVEGVI